MVPHSRGRQRLLLEQQKHPVKGPGVVPLLGLAHAEPQHHARLDDALMAPKRLGMLTARMHIAFAADGVRHASADQVAHWEAEARSDLAEALRLVGGEEGERLRSRAERISRIYGEFREHVGTPLIAVHGDYHVGHVLRVPSADPTLGFDYAVTDFDGNPVRPSEQRSDPQPAAYDVAGMLARSVPSACWSTACSSEAMISIGA